MYHAACLPSFTDSTVVLAAPPTSTPTKTSGSLVTMVSRFNTGRFHLVRRTGSKAWMTGNREYEHHNHISVADLKLFSRKNFLSTLKHYRFCYFNISLFIYFCPFCLDLRQLLSVDTWPPIETINYSILHHNNNYKKSKLSLHCCQFKCFNDPQPTAA